MSKSKEGTFFTRGPASDDGYIVNRDRESREHVRQLVEGLWAQFRPFCGDPHFLSDARAHFHQRTWELYMAGLLLAKGFRLERPPSDGPDLKLLVDDSVVWIEAVAPTSGEGPDAARRKVRRTRQTDLVTIEDYSVDTDKIILRYTSALRDKASLDRHLTSPDGQKSQYCQFLERKRVSQEDAFIVAINAGQIDDADDVLEPPNIVRALFPIGEPKYVVPVDSEEEPIVEHPMRERIEKASGSAVSTVGFLSAEYAGVSAVVFRTKGIWNTYDLQGASIVVVHNPRARVPIPHGTFRFGREYWIEEGDAGAFLHMKDWRGEAREADFVRP